MEKINPSMQGTESNTEHVFSDNQIETSELAFRSYNLGNEFGMLHNSIILHLSSKILKALWSMTHHVG